MAFIAIASYAQTWTAPVAPSSPFEDVEYVADGTTAYYLYNVELGQFVTGANAWATQISLGTGSKAYMQIVVEAIDDEFELEMYPDAVKLKLNGSFKFYGENGYDNGRDISNTYMFRDNEASGFVDHGSQACWYWNFEQNENGRYYWHSASDMGGFDGPNQYAAGKAAGAPVVFNASIEDAGIEWQFVPVEGYDEEAMQAFAASVELFSAKLSLYNLAKEIVDESLNVNYEDYTEVFNGDDLEAIKAATKELEEKIIEAKKQKAFEEGTDENPSDVSFLLVNPDMSGSRTKNAAGKEIPDGWTVEVPGAANYGYQGAGYTNDIDDEETNPNYGVSISGFIEAWVPGTGLGNGRICQTVDLPKGKYVLGVDVIATNQYTSGDAREEATGFELYALGGGIDNGVEVKSYNGKPEHYDFEFVTGGGNTELGLRMIDAMGNWFGADNFTLKYKGSDFDPYILALPNLVDHCYKEFEDLDEVHANTGVKEAYQAALETAEDMLDATEGDFEGVYKALYDALSALQASVADYNGLQEAIDGWNETISKLTGKWEPAAEELADKVSELEDGYDEEAWTAEDIEAALAELRNKYSEIIGSLVEKGDDLTFLLNNPGFASDFSGWSLAEGSANPFFGGANIIMPDDYEPVPELAGTVVDGGCAEVYHAKFDISQTIKNMPAGIFTLSCQAFERDDNSKGIEAELFAIIGDSTNIQVQKIQNIYEDMSDVQLYDSSIQGDNNAGPQNNGDVQYNDGFVPNGMNGSNVFFRAGHYKNYFNIELTEPTDITVGIRTTSDGDWVLFDDFKIVYYGNDADAYLTSIVQLKEELVKLQNSQASGNIITEEADNAANEAINAADAFIENISSASKEDALAMIDQLNKAIEDLKAVYAKTKELKTQWAIYNDYRMDDVNITSDFQGLIEEIGGYVGDWAEDLIKTNAEVDEYLRKLVVLYTQSVQEPYLDATEDNPGDITAVIYNPDGTEYGQSTITNGSYPGWTVENGSVGVGNAGGRIAEFFNTPFEVSQVIYGLAPGYYRLGVQGFYRDGYGTAVKKILEEGENDSVFIHKNAQLYAGEATTNLLLINDEENMAQVADLSGLDGFGGVVNITIDEVDYVIPDAATGAATLIENDLYHNILQFQVVEGQESVTIGIRKLAESAGDWTVLNNWTLEYVGKNAPTTDPTTAIAGVETIAPVKVIYNLAGQRVQKAVKGLYIVNGKKVLVK